MPGSVPVLINGLMCAGTVTFMFISCGALSVIQLIQMASNYDISSECLYIMLYVRWAKQRMALCLS